MIIAIFSLFIINYFNSLCLFTSFSIRIAVLGTAGHSTRSKEYPDYVGEDR